MRRLLFILLLAACSPTRTGPPPPPPRIVLDGVMDDWAGLAPVAGEAPDPAHPTGLGRLWISHDERALLIRFETTRAISLQSGNGLELCLDTDMNAGSGQPVHGIGAELCWRFGDRRGTFSIADSIVEVEHQAIGLVPAPTVTGTDFEVALSRSAEPVPGVPLFRADSLRVVLRRVGGAGPNAPRVTLPAAAGGVAYAFTPVAPPPLAPTTLGRQNPGHVRFLSYNLNDHLMEPARRDALARVLNAIDADVILLQEIRTTPVDTAVAFVRGLLTRDTEGWASVKVGGEHTVVLSRVPIVRADSLGDSGGLVLDLSALGGGWGPLLLVGLSMPCCDQQERRSAEADLIAAYVRDAKSGTGGFQVPQGTPIVLLGDANLVGLERDRRVLTDGAIVDTARYGAGAAPDWDGSPLRDLLPRHTHRPWTFTWYGEDFPPGRLDYLFYSDASLDIGTRFVLYTPEIPADVLAAWGLEAGDTDVVTDHLPVVADLHVESSHVR